MAIFVVSLWFWDSLWCDEETPRWRSFIFHIQGLPIRVFSCSQCVPCASQGFLLYAEPRTGCSASVIGRRLRISRSIINQKSWLFSNAFSHAHQEILCLMNELDWHKFGNSVVIGIMDNSIFNLNSRGLEKRNLYFSYIMLRTELVRRMSLHFVCNNNQPHTRDLYQPLFLVSLISFFWRIWSVRWWW